MSVVPQELARASARRRSQRPPHRQQRWVGRSGARAEARAERRQHQTEQYQDVIQRLGFRCEPNSRAYQVSTRNGPKTFRPGLVAWVGARPVLIEVVFPSGDDGRVKNMGGLHRLGKSTLVLKTTELSMYQKCPIKLRHKLEDRAGRK